MDNMTALVSTFARAYHHRNSSSPVFAEPLAEKMLTEEEYAGIAQTMSDGISYFAPDFRGTGEEALRFVVNHQLAPSVLARSAFCEQALSDAVNAGCRQIVIYACGYDTFSLRTGNRELSVYELDRPEMIEDRQRRIARIGIEPVCRVECIGCDLADNAWRQNLEDAGFNRETHSFGSLLGISYYLSKDAFKRLIAGIGSIACRGSFICFDYPLTESDPESRRNRELAAAAGEQMKAAYTPDELEQMLADSGFCLHRRLNAEQAESLYFTAYNEMNPDSAMTPPVGVGYCVAMKQ